MRKLKTTFIALKLFKFVSLAILIMDVLAQPTSAYIYDAEQHAVHPFGETYDYGFKYSPEVSSQLSNADEIDSSGYDMYESNENGLGHNFYNINNEKRSSRIHVYPRGCIRRNGACDHRPKDCCYNSSCRCNLWGSNCRCQRMGLFQKWG